MRKIFCLVVIGSLFLPSVHADSYLETKYGMTKNPAKIWVKGKMQRQEMDMQGMGSHIFITRVDKGISWNINPKNKTYTEMQIALPYSAAGLNTKKKMAADKEECTPDYKKLSTTRSIAGEVVTGYSIGCKEKPKDTTLIWMAPLNSTTKKVLNDQKVFAAAYMKALFANFPPEEKEDSEKLASFFSQAGGQLPSSVGFDNMPEGYPYAVEAESNKKGKQSLYEVLAISADPIDNSKFEIPASYKKTESVNLNDLKIPTMGKEPMEKEGKAPGSKKAPFDMKSILDQMKKNAK